MTTAVERGKRRIVEGWVVSDKMNKTRVVAVKGSKKHSTYGKIMGTTSKLKMHDEKNESKEGDRVLIMETRSLSKTKNWRLLEILKKH